MIIMAQDLTDGTESSGEYVPPSGPPDSTAPANDSSRLPFRTQLLYSSGFFGTGVFYAFNNFILSLYLGLVLHAPSVVYGLLSSTHSIEGSVIQPLVGAWSDRTWWKRLGRRRPFIVIFVPISALFLVMTAFAPQAGGLGKLFGATPNVFALVLVSIGIFVFSVTFNIMLDPYTALLADITPVGQRGHVNGLFQMVGAAGQVAILVFSAFILFPAIGNAGYFVLFLVTAAAMLVFFIPTVLGVREPRELVDAPVHHRYRVRDYWRALRGERQVQLYFATQFFLWFGISAITPFLGNYAVRVIGLNADGALLLSFILLGSTALFNWPFGALADRIGVKRVFLVGMILMAGASIAGIFIRQVLPLYVVLFIAGIGNAAQTGSSYPMLTRIVRPDRMGLYTGLNSTVTSIATPASVAIAGILIDGVGYNALFPFVAAMFLLALVPLAALNMRAGEAKIRAELRAEIDAPAA